MLHCGVDFLREEFDMRQRVGGVGVTLERKR